MSSFIVSKTDSNSKPSSPRPHRPDENTVRQAMQKLFLHDNINDSSLAGDDDDVRSGQSFKNNHAKFTSITLWNFDRMKIDFFFSRRIIIRMDHIEF
jgi:hypothetical protein